MPQWPATDLSSAPLDDAELDRLSELLERYAVPAGGMSLEMVDGFLSGLAVAPEPVPPEEFEPWIWGGEEPTWASSGDARDAHGLLMRMAAFIERRVRILPEDLQAVHMPVLAQPEPAPADEDTEFELGKEWAVGFLDAVDLRPEAWGDWEEALDWVAADIGEIALLAGAEDPPLEQPLSFIERDGIVAEIPHMLHALDQQRRLDRPQQPVRAQPQPGRNDPCPCGSGRKYKKCCGGSAVRH